MSKFTVSSVEAVEYDFTAIPKDSGEGTCEGKGFVPEPSKKRMKSFFKSIGELASSDSGENLENMTEDQALNSLNSILENSDRDRGRMEEVVAELTQGSPSKAQLSQLPPRYFSAFTAYLLREISDPNA